jgi:hypothetical protein
MVSIKTNLKFFLGSSPPPPHVFSQCSSRLYTKNVFMALFSVMGSAPSLQAL